MWQQMSLKQKLRKLKLVVLEKTGFSWGHMPLGGLVLYCSVPSQSYYKLGTRVVSFLLRYGILLLGTSCVQSLGINIP